MRKGKGNIKMLDRNYKYLSILIMILITFGFSAKVHGEGGEIMDWFKDARPGMQQARAMAVDPATGYTAITGYSTESGSQDYYTVVINENGGMVTGWPKLFDSSSNNADRAEAVVFDNAGNIIVTGYSMNSDINTDIHTIKYRADGVVIWQATYSATISGNDVGIAVAVDSSDNVYVGGHSMNTSPNNDYKVIKYPSGSDYDPIPSPDYLWVQTYDGGGEDTVADITVTADGVAVTGASHNGTNLDCVTIKYDLINDGAEIWSSEQRYAGLGNDDDQGKAVRMDSAGNVYVLAVSFDADDDFYTVKYNSATGAIEAGWPQIHDGGFFDEPADMFIDSAANVYVTGHHTFEDGSNGFYTAKYNSGGTLVWEDVYHSSNGDANDDSAASIIVNDTDAPDAPAAVFVAGVTLVNDLHYDFRTVKYTIGADTPGTGGGNLLWSEAFDGSGGSNNMNDMIVGTGFTTTGDVIVAGWTEGAVNGYDYYWIKYKPGLLNRPTDFAATVDLTTQITLSWSDNSSNETGFKIERCEASANCPGTEVLNDFVQIYLGTTENEISYPDSTVNNDTKYYYRVRAYNGGDNSNYSNEVYAVTTIQTYTPFTWQYDNLVSTIDVATDIDVGPDLDPVVTGYIFDPLEKYDYYTVKIDRDTGLAKWPAAQYSGGLNNTDMAVSITVDNNDDIVVTGHSFLYTEPPGDFDSNDIYTRKYLSTGSVDWGHQYLKLTNNDDTPVVVDVSIDTLNNYIVLGEGEVPIAGGDDYVYLIKYDVDGFLWDVTYDSTYNEIPVAVAFDPSGNIIVVGSQSNGTDLDFFIAKYDSDGGLDTSWLAIENANANPVIFDGTYDDEPKAMAIDPAGNIYVTGTTTINAQGDKDFYTVKYNGQTGLVESGWPQTYGGYAGGFDEPIAIAIDPVNNDVVVAGTTSNVNGSTSIETVDNGENDFHTIRYKSDGTLVWQRTLDRPVNDDRPKAMAMDLSGNVHIVGKSENAVDPTTGWDAFSIQYDHNGTFIKGTIVNGPGDANDEATAVTVNAYGEAFIAGKETDSAFISDYLVYKIDGYELQVPLPFTAGVNYITVDFTWTDNSEDETSYQLQRHNVPNTCAGDNWSDIYNSTGISYIDDNATNGLTPGTTYCYRIRTYNDVPDPDEYSRWVDKTVTTVVLPDVSGLSATALTSTDIYLSWTDTTTSETIFNIKRCTGSGIACDEDGEFTTSLATISSPDIPGSGSTVSYTDTTACQGETYTYRVNAQKTTVPIWTSLGWNYSNSVTADSIAAAFPDGLTASFVSEVQLDLSWNDNTSDETGFRVERCDEDANDCASSFVVDGSPQTVLSVPTNNVMLLNMDEGGWNGTADEVADSSGSGYHGQAYGGATTDAGGQYGYAGSFDGDGDYVDVGDRANLDFGSSTDFTIEAWIKTSTTGVNQGIIDKRTSSQGYFLGVNSSNTITAYIRYSSGSVSAQSDVLDTVTDGLWHHVVAVYDRDDKLTIYIDGNQSGTEPAISGIGDISSTGKAVIGYHDPALSSSWSYFNGLIDRVAIYNRALTATEADDRFNNVVRYSDSSVPNVNNNYTYRVRAFKTATGCAGGEWNTIYSTTASEASDVVDPSLLSATPIDSSWIELEWTDNTASETGFRILRCDGSCDPDNSNDPDNTNDVHLLTTITGTAGMGSKVSYSDKSVCAGLEYSYEIEAINPSWISGPSNTASATTDTTYMPVSTPVINKTESQIEFEWADTTDDETGYRIERCNDANGTCASDFIIDPIFGTQDVLSIPSGNVMLLHMDEAYWDGQSGDVIDSSGAGYNGTSYGGATTKAGGQISRAGSFDGATQSINTSLNLNQSTASAGATMEAWVKPASLSGLQEVISTEDDDREWGISINNSTWRYYNGSSYVNTPFTADVDEWQHVVAVFNPGTGVTFYKNGVSSFDDTIAYQSNNDDRSVRIGRAASYSKNYYEGLIDEVAIYTRPLTTDEVAARYLSGRPSTSVGTAETGSSTTIVRDTTQQWTNDEWIDYYLYIVDGDAANVGKIRQITDNNLNTLTADAFDADVTGDSYRIVSAMKYEDTTGLDWNTNYSYRIRAYKTTSGCGVLESDNSSLINTSTDDPVEPTDLDGTVINTTDIRLDWTDNTTSETDFEIERKCISGDDPDCNTSYVRVDIDGEPGANLTANGTYTDDTLCENTTYVYQVRAKKDPDAVKHNGRRYICILNHVSADPAGDDEPGDGSSSTTYWSDDGTAGSEPDWDVATHYSADWKTDPSADTTNMPPYTLTTDNYIAPDTLTATTVTEEQIDITWTDNNIDETSFKIDRCEVNGAGADACSEGFFELGTLSTAYGDMLVFHMDEQSWGTVVDSSEGGNYNASASGGAGTVGGGKPGRAGSFNGAGQYISTSLNLDQASSSSPGVTMAAWVKPASASSGAHHVISTEGIENEWTLYRDGASWRVKTGEGTFTTGFAVDIDEWQHIAAMFAPGVGITVYKNGVAVSTSSIGYKTGDRNVTIGMKYGGSAYFDGLIDEVAIYNRPLSFTEIYHLDPDEWKSDSGTIDAGPTNTTIKGTGKAWATDGWSDYYVVIINGVAAGENRKIISNTSDTLTIESISPVPGEGDSYEIVTYLRGDANSGSTFTVIDTDKNWTADEWINYYVVMETGSNKGQIRKIVDNDPTGLTVGTAFTNTVSSGDSYKIVPYLQGAQSYSSKRYSDTGLATGKTYRYQVRGYKDTSCKWPVDEYSNDDETKIDPPAPSDFVATKAGTTQINTSWTDNTKTETGFNIFRCEYIPPETECTIDYNFDDESWDLLTTEPAGPGTGLRTYIDTTVCEDTEYKYRVVAIYRDGGDGSTDWDSDPSNEYTAKTDNAPAPVLSSITQVLESELILKWQETSVDEEGFKIYRCADPCTINTDNDLITIVATNIEAFTDTGLKPGQTYKYEVHAFNTSYTCDWVESDAGSASTTAVTKPDLTVTPVSTTRIDLDWTDSTTSETGFEIYGCAGICDPDPLADGVLITTVGPDVTSYSNMALCKEETYTYSVRPVNEGLSNSGGGCWTKNVALTITDFQPNYPTKVIIDDYTNYTGMQSDFDDIRFYDATAQLELPYVIESINGNEATVYFKTMVNNNIFMYFNNSSAISSSNTDRVYEFYQDFRGTLTDTQTWYEVDPYNEISQNDDLIFNGSISTSWNKLVISQQAFSRLSGKTLYISWTPFNTPATEYYKLGWDRNVISTSASSNPMHSLYGINGYPYIQEYNNQTYNLYSYLSLGSNYTIKIVLKDSGAMYYIKGGSQYPVWILVKETITNSDALMRIAVHQYNAGLNIHLIKIQNFALVEPSVTNIGAENGTGCFSFSTLWTTGPYSDEVSNATKIPGKPTFLTAESVGDTQIDLTWTDNSDDESGFKIERCLGDSGTCTQDADFTEIDSIQGYDPSIGMLLNMDEPSWHGASGEVVDSAGSNNGTSYAGANTTTGGFYRAGSFDGDNDYITVPNSSGINPTEEITVSLWAASNTSTWNDTGMLASKRNSYILSPVTGSNMEIRFYVYTTLNWYSATFNLIDLPLFDLTEWHHYVGTYDGKDIKLYVDGSPVGTPTTRPGGINPDAGALYIGRDDGSSTRYFDGLIDEVIIYGKALSDTEVQDLYSQEIPSNTDYSDTISPSQDYCYQVRAYKTASGCGGEWNSDYSSITCTKTAPVAPSNLEAVPYNSLSIDLAWDYPDTENDELGFVVERKIWGGTYITIATLGPNIKAYYDYRGLEPDQTYTYRISAYNDEGASNYSNEDSATTKSWLEGDRTCEE